MRVAVVYYGAVEVAKIRLDVPLLYARAGRDVPALIARDVVVQNSHGTERLHHELALVRAGVEARGVRMRVAAPTHARALLSG